MIKIEITDVPPFSGLHEIDTDIKFNGHELHLIKKVSGVRLGEINEAAEAMDYDLTIALAVIALMREQKVKREDASAVVDLLMDAPGGNIKLLDPEEEDARPPDQQHTGSEKNEKPDESSPTSSTVSNGHSDDHPETIPASIGDRG